jgi:hypothetical protein
MHNKSRKWKALLLAVAATAGGAQAHAQSADALIDKLVDKGILTMKEAKDLRDEADKGFTQAYQVKSGMPDWVTTFKIGGDFRGRYDSILYPSVNPTIDQHRFRYRLRLGAVATIRDNFEVGLRLTSSEAQGAFGGDPISGNTSFADNASKKFIYIDQAYAKWTALNTPDFLGVLTVGKMENPFVFSEMIFDGDYTPEGAAANLNYNIDDKHTLKLNTGGFMLDEAAGDSNDPFLVGSQLRWDAAWTPKIQSSIGAAILSVVGARGTNSLLSGAAGVPDRGHGNSRTGGGLDNTFTTFVGDAGVTYSLDHFWGYNAIFPIRVGGEYAQNLIIDDRNKAYSLGVTFGKSGKKGLWDVSYKWKEMQGDFWYEELVDSDFGGYSAGASAFASGGGYRNGTNLRGHVVKAQYSPFDSFTLAGTVYIADVIDTVGIAYNTHVTRIQLDAIWKF